MSLQKKQKDYVESLTTFLKASSEVTIVDEIVRQLKLNYPDWWRTLIHRKRFKILDIGSGDGSKSIYFSSILARNGVKVVVDAIEPTAENRLKLIQCHKATKNNFLGKIWNKPLKDVK